MCIEASTLDDLMRGVFAELVKRPFDNYPTRSHGMNPTSEIVGAMLLLKNPRARLSRSETRGKPFSAIGELLWYLSKGNELKFIEYYIDKYKDESSDGQTIHSGYGPRLFNLHGKIDQMANVIKLLKGNQATRRAVLQIFDGEDLVGHKEVPCTCTLQFIIRQGKLHMVTFIRSNDAYKGLPHDIFAFTMLQEIIARSISVDLGDYYHSVGSLHLYFDDRRYVEQFFNEGYQSTKSPMPDMPIGDPWKELELLLDIESKIRLGLSYSLEGLSPYWADIARLLQIYSLLNSKDYTGIKKVRDIMNSSVYNAYIDKKLDGHL